MSARADLLLDSPTGRDLLVGFLGCPGGFQRFLYDQLGLGPVPGSAPLVPGGQAPPARLSRWLTTVTGGAQRPPSADGPAESWRAVPAATVAAVVAEAVAARRWEAPLARAGELELLGELASGTDRFGFGGGDDAERHLSGLAADELRPVAEALLQAPATARWWDAIDLTGQRFAEWDDLARLTGDALAQAVREDMADARTENTRTLRERRPRRERPGVRYGAYWWSVPSIADLSWTTPAAGPLPAASLFRFFDTYGPGPDCGGATVWSVQIDPAARVLEIGGPADWQQLVARFPRDVTGTHDGEWRYWGGVPGPWRLPDWEQVMTEHDGVHVSIGGYLTGSGVALPADGGYTMLSAWIPGATLWLRDMVTGSRRLGRWEGGPQSGPELEVPPQWQPAAS